MKISELLDKAKGGVTKFRTLKDELSNANQAFRKVPEIDKIDTTESNLDNFEENQKTANNQWMMIGIAAVVVILILFRKKLKF